MDSVDERVTMTTDLARVRHLHVVESTAAGHLHTAVEETLKTVKHNLTETGQTQRR